MNMLVEDREGTTEFKPHANVVAATIGNGATGLGALHSYIVKDDETWRFDVAMASARSRRGLSFVILTPDAGFDAVMRMKTEPLVLGDAEAEVFEDLRQQRARPIGKPLPLDE